MCWIIAASAVDFPEPVMPVTSTSPRGFIAISSSTGGQVQLGDRARLVRNGAHRVAERAALLIHVHAEAADARHADREVALLVLGELLDLPRRHQLLGERLEILRAERRMIERHEIAVHAKRRRTSDLEVQVGARCAGPSAAGPP